MVASRYFKREKGSLPVNVRRSKTSLLKLPYMASEASCVRTRKRAGKPFSLPSPFACGSRVTSRDSPKWRACSQAWPTAKTCSCTLAIANTTMPVIGCDYSCSSSIAMPRGTLRGERFEATVFGDLVSVSKTIDAAFLSSSKASVSSVVGSTVVGLIRRLLTSIHVLYK